MTIVVFAWLVAVHLIVFGAAGLWILNVYERGKERLRDSAP